MTNEKILSQLAFFGVSPKTAPIIRVNLFTQIHEICFHGQGGYSWETVYNMPRWLRLFTFNKIKQYYEEKNKPNKPNTTSIVDKNGQVSAPSFAKQAVSNKNSKSTYK